ncbi:MAG TPA: hypothetical protein VGM91_03035 [Conexibacter sp.]
MRLTRLRLVLLICALLASAAAVPAAASAAATRPAGLLNCARNLQVKPKVFTLACGDGNVGLSSLRWTSFGGASARATGIFAVNQCDPNCASGTVLRRRVTVVATRPGMFGGKRTYSRLALTGKTGRSLGRYGIDSDGPYTREPR